MAVHGDVTEITVNHPDLGNRTLFPVANQGNKFFAGGLTNADDANGVTSNGELIVTKTRGVGFFEVLIEDDSNEREDANFIKQLAESPKPATYTLSLINGTVWSGKGVPVGNYEVDLNAGTMPLKVNSGNFTKL